MRTSRTVLTIAGIALVALALVPLAAPAQVYVKNNRLGVGIDDPTLPFHLFTASGNPAFLFERGASGAQWNFKVDGLDQFAISRVGTGAEFILKQQGGANTLFITGGIRASAFNIGSSRSLKQDFLALDGRDVLAKVAAMPISEWTYKDDPQSERHIGPMAEDFHAAFGVGSDEKTLSVSDATGVALAAIKGLHQELEAKNEQIGSLERRLQELERLLGDR